MTDITGTGTFPFFLAPWYRRSPYFEATKRHGCKSWDLYNHMLIPSLFMEDDLEEYWQIVNEVAVWDVGVERQVEITGSDAFAFTNMLTPRDLTKCAVTQCKYVLITNQYGGIVNDPILLRLGENHFWLSISDSDVLLWAMGVAANSGLDVKLREPDVSPMQIQGPRSKGVVSALFGDSILDLGYYWCRELDLDGIPLVVSRTGWTGEVGYELYLRDGSRGDDLWERVMRVGAPFGIKPTAPSENRRIEAGIFNWGSDMTIEDNPFEVTGLERLVEDQDADYIGKEALRRIRSEGVKRKLVGVELQGERLKRWLEDYWPVRKDGEVVGKLTSASYSPRLERDIGYIWVPIEHAAEGTEVEILSPDGPVAARVSRLPFLDPKKTIPVSGTSS